MSPGRGWDEPPLPGGQRPARPGPLLLAALAAAFAAALLVGLLLASEPAERFPLETLGRLSDKLAYLDEHRAELDLVFVGSSRVFRAIVPDVVDAEAARLGCVGLRSYNLGWPGMSAPMMARVAQRVSRAPGERHRVVLIEPVGAHGPALQLAAHPHARFANSAATAPLGFLQLWVRPPAEQLASSRLPARLTQLRLSLRYLATLLASSLPVGSAQRAAFAEAPLPEPPDELLRAQRGYHGLEQAVRTGDPEVRALLEKRRLDRSRDAAAFAGWVSDLERAKAGERAPLSALEARFVEGLLAAAEGPRTRAGALLPPILRADGLLWSRRVVHHLESRAPERPVAFAPPEDLRPLYAMGRWFDRGHLGDAGARLFSRAVARDLCPAVLESLQPRGVRTGSR